MTRLVSIRLWSAAHYAFTRTSELDGWQAAASRVECNENGRRAANEGNVRLSVERLSTEARKKRRVSVSAQVFAGQNEGIGNSGFVGCMDLSTGSQPRKWGTLSLGTIR